MDLRDKILALARSGTPPSFVSVAQLPGAKGDKVLTVPGKNVILWGGLSAAAISALQSLVADGLVRLEPTDALVYAADGILPSMPRVRSERTAAKGYKHPHWLPTVLVAAG